jgi:hypothetical protein
VQQTPDHLAAIVVAGYGRETVYPPITAEGASKAAQEILSLVE